MSALELVAARKSGQLTARELVEYFLGRIEQHNNTLNALVTVTADEALRRAELMDQGHVDPGILWGLPFADKDLSHRAGVHTGWGSRVGTAAPIPEVSDPVVVAMDVAGGISLGKSAVCEFGLSSYTESEVFPPTKNPFSLLHGSGGSSGGAAAAVAGGLLPLAPASDGGGSIRIPAWTCGLVGMKPSRGLIPAGTGFDSLGGLVVPGALAHTLGDAALLMDALRGHRPTYRATGVSASPASFVDALEQPMRKLRVGVSLAHPWGDGMGIDISPDALAALDQVAELARDIGHTVADVEWTPRASYADAFATLWRASAATLDIPAGGHDVLENLTRYLVEEGAKLSARELALALRELAQFETHAIEAFSPYDIVLTPGLATAAPELGWYDKEDAERNFRQQIQVTPFSSFVNVSGLPALALPVSLTGHGLPVGVQLIGGPGGDATVLALGHQLSSQLSWGHQRPAIW
jgi:amidase